MGNLLNFRMKSVKSYSGSGTIERRWRVAKSGNLRLPHLDCANPGEPPMPSKQGSRGGWGRPEPAGQMAGKEGGKGSGEG